MGENASLSPKDYKISSACGCLKISHLWWVKTISPYHEDTFLVCHIYPHHGVVASSFTSSPISCFGTTRRSRMLSCMSEISTSSPISWHLQLNHITFTKSRCVAASITGIVFIAISNASLLFLAETRSSDECFLVFFAASRSVIVACSTVAKSDDPRGHQWLFDGRATGAVQHSLPIIAASQCAGMSLSAGATPPSLFDLRRFAVIRHCCRGDQQLSFIKLPPINK